MQDSWNLIIVGAAVVIAAGFMFGFIAPQREGHYVAPDVFGLGGGWVEQEQGYGFRAFYHLVLSVLWGSAAGYYAGEVTANELYGNKKSD